MRMLLGRRQRAERAHVVEPVGQLDEDDADVLGHGQEHLADVLGLLLLVGQGAELAQLGDAVDEAGHVGPEAFLDVAERVLGVLGDVVQEGGRDRDRVQAQLGQDLGHRQRVGDVGLAADAVLALVRLHGEGEGGRDRRQVGLRVALVQLLLDLLERALHAGRREVLRRRRSRASLRASAPGRALGLDFGGRLGRWAGHRRSSVANCSLVLADIDPCAGPEVRHSTGRAPSASPA